MDEALGELAQPRRQRVVLALARELLEKRRNADTLGGNGGAPLPTPATTSTGFDWADAGIGAATAVGTVFVLLGGTLLVARRRGQLAI